jgi:hypothetical protein
MRQIDEQIALRQLVNRVVEKVFRTSFVFEERAILARATTSKFPADEKTCR